MTLKKQEPNQPVSYSRDDYDTLRAGMKKYKDERVNKRLRTPFIQYMAERGVIRFDDASGDGFCISSPIEYTKWNNVRAKIQAYDDAKLDEVLESMPEEKAAWRAKIKALGESLRV